MARSISLVFLLLFAINGLAQSNKSLKKENVKNYTVKVYNYSSGKEKSKISEYISFDKNGNILEEKIYDENGKLEKHTESVYDENGNKISKTFYFPNGKIKKVNKYFYEGKLRVAKYIYDGQGSLKYKEEYIYEKFNED